MSASTWNSAPNLTRGNELSTNPPAPMWLDDFELYSNHYKAYVALCMRLKVTPKVPQYPWMRHYEDYLKFLDIWEKTAALEVWAKQQVGKPETQVQSTRQLKEVSTQTEPEVKVDNKLAEAKLNLLNLQARNIEFSQALRAKRQESSSQNSGHSVKEYIYDDLAKEKPVVVQERITRLANVQTSSREQEMDIHLKQLPGKPMRNNSKPGGKSAQIPRPPRPPRQLTARDRAELAYDQQYPDKVC